MEKSQSSCKIKSHITYDEMYDVVMYNDDFTTMDFVVLLLKTVFFQSTDAAINMMLTIHKKGKCIVGTYNIDIAHSKKQKAVMMAREAGFPLQIKVTKHID